MPNTWKHILPKHLQYKKPHLVFATDTRPDFYRNLFYAAAMFKVGKHEFIVREPKQVFDRYTFEWEDRDVPAPGYSYFTNVSDIRVEDIHPCKYILKSLNISSMLVIKTAVTLKNVRKFYKEKSVFAPWKEDNARTL